MIFETQYQSSVVGALLEYHPYEEVAYQIISTENVHQNVGMGMIGELTEGIEENNFLKNVKKIFKTGCIKHSALRGRPIKKVAVLGGSGSFAISDAIRLQADMYISADFKYHDFLKAEGKIVLVDVGHYESEQFTKTLLVEYLIKKLLILHRSR